MHYKTDILTQEFTLNGVHYPAPIHTPPQEWIEILARKEPQLIELTSFLTEWFDPSPTLTVHTSGSTGVPKPLVVEKKRMIESAVATCSFLQLQPQQSAFLCMPVRYIAGKMMVVRTLVASLNLLAVAPSSHPLRGVTAPPAFAAMTPMQVYNSLQQPEERKLLSEIKQLIIGGGAIHQELETELHNFPHAVWSTYGMTETLSHIALRRLNGETASKYYKPLPGIEVKSNDAGQLIINAPALCSEVLVTNDIVLFNEAGYFYIKGRKDNTINSGGVKIQIEEVEEMLQPALKEDFAVTSIPDKEWGDKMVLLTTYKDTALVKEICKKILPAYWQPKEILFTKSIPKTETGKISRKENQILALECAKEQLKNTREC